MVTGNNISDSKNRNSIKLIKLISLSLFTLLVIGSIGNVQATVVFYDDFEDGDLSDWELYGWNDASGVNVAMEPEISIINGAMKTPDSSSSVTTSLAQRNSTTVVGTWSFDIILSTGTSSEDATRFSVHFMFTDLNGNYDRTGFNESDFQ